jgi:hypothetical protein
MRSEELRVSVAYPEGVLAGTVSKHYGLSSEMFSGSLFSIGVNFVNKQNIFPTVH